MAIKHLQFVCSLCMVCVDLSNVAQGRLFVAVSFWSVVRGKLEHRQSENPLSLRFLGRTQTWGRNAWVHTANAWSSPFLMDSLVPDAVFVRVSYVDTMTKGKNLLNRGRNEGTHWQKMPMPNSIAVHSKDSLTASRRLLVDFYTDEHNLMGHVRLTSVSDSSCR